MSLEQKKTTMHVHGRKGNSEFLFLSLCKSQQTCLGESLCRTRMHYFLNMDILLCVTSAVRIERLSDAARTNQDALRGTQAEITEYRRQLQSRTIELETLRGTQESLERQRIDSEDRHHDDLNSLQAGTKKILLNCFARMQIINGVCEILLKCQPA